MPILECPNGRILRQSKAWWRHVARRKGPYPTDVDQAMVHDWVIDNYYDIFEPITKVQ